MKKALAVLCLFAITMVTQKAFSASPDGFFFAPYGGIDYEHVGVGYKDVPGTSVNYGELLADSLNGANFHVGARVNKYLGFEGGYSWTADADKNNVRGTGLNTDTHVAGWNADALGYLPLGNEKFEMIGTMGVSLLTASLNLNGAASGSGNVEEFGFRAGGGAEYWITDHINGRVLLRYQTADFHGIADDAYNLTAGINYQF